MRIGLATVEERQTTAALTSWRDGPTKQAIVDFVASATPDRQGFIPAANRIATFDNDAPDRKALEPSASAAMTSAIAPDVSTPFSAR